MNEVIYYTIKALEALQQSGQEDISISDENVKFLLSLVSDDNPPTASKITPNNIDEIISPNATYQPITHEDVTPYAAKESEQQCKTHSTANEKITPNNIDEIISPNAIYQPIAHEDVTPYAAKESEQQCKNYISLPEGNKEEQWLWLRSKVMTCPICNKNLNPGKKIVFGVGNLYADIFLCGEAPGADEEIVGEPFVGRAGQLLTKIIAAMGLSRTDVYIGNIMNWRPKMPTDFGNRPPTKEEMQFCLPYLCAQLQIVKPKVILALGATALNGLLGHDNSRKMSKVRGKWLEFNGIKLMPTFHPSYVLRNNGLQTKRMIWEDFMKVMEFLNMPISNKQQKFFT
ncbi:MAG: uracil-DNA glycosylase [Puniceicoccales bacterium]|jgi:DNA polymerase|nr:uracil-DNA glycosylase [Puniceicoccales bacterium]